MTTSLPDALGVGSRLELGGQKWNMSPLFLNDLGSLSRFIGDEILERAGRVSAKLSAEFKKTTEIVYPMAWDEEQRLRAERQSAESTVKLLMQIAHEQSNSFSVWTLLATESGIQELMQWICRSPVVLAHVVWLALRGNHPALRETQVADWLAKDPRTPFEIVGRIFALSLKGWQSEESSPKAGPEISPSPP